MIMANAIGLMLMLPSEYFEMIQAPLSAGMLSFAPAIGVTSLIAGIVLAIARPAKALLLFLIPVGFSEAFVAFAGLMLGQFPRDTGTPIILGFLAVQLVLSAWLVHRCRAALPAALLFATFSLTFGFFAAFIGGMALANDWL
jgi:hypothetical protein